MEIWLALIVCLLLLERLFFPSFLVVWHFHWTLLYSSIVVFALDKVINSHDLLLPLFDINRYPYVTGTSVIALKYKDGVIMACDTGG